MDLELEGRPQAAVPLRQSDRLVARRNDEIVGHFCNDHRTDLPVFEPYPCGVCGASAEHSNATPIARDGDIAELVFRVDCCLVRLDARGISDDVVRSIAASMTALELDDWRSELGTRLLVDDQT